MADIFLSYAREDLEAARNLAGMFEACGWRTFWGREIPRETSQLQYVEKELQSALCIVVLWSKASVESSWVLEEAIAGFARGMLFPVLIDGTAPPSSFRAIQSEDLVDWRGDPEHPGFRRLIGALSVVLGEPKEITATQKQARVVEETKRRVERKRQRSAEEKRGRVTEDADRRTAEAIGKGEEEPPDREMPASPAEDDAKKMATVLEQGWAKLAERKSQEGRPKQKTKPEEKPVVGDALGGAKARQKSRGENRDRPEPGTSDTRSDIFLSYAREDLEHAQKLVAIFEKQGWSTFWDRTIPPGTTWDKFIDRKLDEASCVIVLWSAASIASNWVLEEAEDGLESEKLIPATIEKVKPPRGFRRIQAADLSNWRGGQDHTGFRQVQEEVSKLIKRRADMQLD